MALNWKKLKRLKEEKTRIKVAPTLEGRIFEAAFVVLAIATWAVAARIMGLDHAAIAKCLIIGLFCTAGAVWLLVEPYVLGVEVAIPEGAEEFTQSMANIELRTNRISALFAMPLMVALVGEGHLGFNTSWLFWGSIAADIIVTALVAKLFWRKR